MAAKFSIREYFGRLQRHLAWIAARVTVIGIAFVPLPLAAQTPSTGSISGVVVNQTGAVVPGSVVDLTNIKTESKKSVNSDELGRFAFLLLTPGRYVLSAGMPGVASFKAEAIVDVSVTEVIDAELQLKITAPSQSIDVVASSGEIQNGNPALGQVINEPAVSSLPLATRNFAQLVGLTPGVATGVSNAGELGLGDTALSQIARSNDGLFVHGARS